MRENLKIETVLIEEGLVTRKQLEHVLRMQATTYRNQTVEELLVKLQYITEEQLTEALGRYLRVPYINLKTYPIDHEVVNILDEKIARKYHVVPIKKEGNRLTVGMTDPLNLYAIEEIHLFTNLEVDTVICTRTDIQGIIERAYSGRQAFIAAHQLQHVLQTRKLDEVGAIQLNHIIDTDPVVKMVNSVIEQGIKLGVSDIHIEPGREATRVRMRIDGQLQEQRPINKAAHELVVGRLKVMAYMNTAEKRVPQDGQCELMMNQQKVNMRISILPTLYGEKVVIRILNTQDNTFVSIDELGLIEHNKKLFDKIIRSSNGIILVTGPTGSGKSTTLYSILSECNKMTDNIVTLEDPVEKKLDGINQVQINNKAGLTFANGLRSILRQDPDIIMLGEIRDTETASVAIRSAITGHLVFSTLHTKDAASTIIRLVDMGVESYMVASALVGVIAQRLVRRICPYCRKSYESTAEELRLLKLKEPIIFYRGEGCQACNFTGYKGRTAIHEIIVVTSDIRTMINKGMQSEEIKAYAQTQGTILLQDNMRQLVLEGITTTEEFIKIVYSLE